MKMSGYVAGAAMALLILGPNAIAQQGPTPGQPGSTTGPAAGTIAQPSTAVQKETPTAGSRGATAASDLPREDHVWYLCLGLMSSIKAKQV